MWVVLDAGVDVIVAELEVNELLAMTRVGTGTEISENALIVVELGACADVVDSTTGTSVVEEVDEAGAEDEEDSEDVDIEAAEDDDELEVALGCERDFVGIKDVGTAGELPGEVFAGGTMLSGTLADGLTSIIE